MSLMKQYVDDEVVVANEWLRTEKLMQDKIKNSVSVNDSYMLTKAFMNLVPVFDEARQVLEDKLNGRA